MISTPDRQTAIALINEAITAGARRAKACAALEISDRTLRRWTKAVRSGLISVLSTPGTGQQAQRGRTRCRAGGLYSKEFSSLPPSQIVPTWPIRYLASESSFYRTAGDGPDTEAAPLRCGANHPPAITEVWIGT